MMVVVGLHCSCAVGSSLPGCIAVTFLDAFAMPLVACLEVEAAGEGNLAIGSVHAHWADLWPVVVVDLVAVVAEVGIRLPALVRRTEGGLGMPCRLGQVLEAEGSIVQTLAVRALVVELGEVAGEAAQTLDVEEPLRARAAVLAVGEQRLKSTETRSVLTLIAENLTS